MSKTYSINEIFYSIQGEGLRAGTANVFVRFAGCNLTCSIEHEGFDCDTNFSGGRKLTLYELMCEIAEATPNAESKYVILTGGEPALQIDAFLITALKMQGYFISIETNGTKELPEGIDYVCCSPKTAEHTLRLLGADEVKYVMHRGQALPKPQLFANNYFISPACQPDGTFKREDVEWCVQLVKENPKWRLSIQSHKLLGVR